MVPNTCGSADDIFGLNRHWLEEFAGSPVEDLRCAVPFKIQGACRFADERGCQGRSEDRVVQKSGWALSPVHKKVLDAMDKGLRVEEGGGCKGKT